MNAEIAEKWVAALRSGEYKQCRGRLRRTDDQPGVTGFCCLGVLCDLYVKETKRGMWIESTAPDGVVFAVIPLATASGLPEAPQPSPWSGTILTHAVMAWAGMRDAGGLPKHGEASLAELNDGGRSFTDIAEFIENNVSQL